MAKKIEVVSEFPKPTTARKIQLAFDGAEVEAVLPDGQRNTIAEVTESGTLRLWVLTGVFKEIFETDKQGHIVIELE